MTRSCGIFPAGSVSLRDAMLGGLFVAAVVVAFVVAFAVAVAFSLWIGEPVVLLVIIISLNRYNL